MNRNALTGLGLVLALIGPGVVALLALPATGASFALPSSAIWLCVFIALFGAVATIATMGEGLSWADLGFRHTGRYTIPTSITLSLFFILVFGPLAYWVLARSGLGSFAAGQSALAALPLWYLCLTIIIVGAGEEWLYRGYAIERLEALTGNPWLAAGISLFAFALVHLPLWGSGVALTTVVSGGILTAVYLWRRDVMALILAHVATDLYGLVPAPMT